MCIVKILMNSCNQLSQRLMEAYLKRSGIQGTVIAVSDMAVAADIVNACQIDALIYYSENPETDKHEKLFSQMAALNPDLIIMLLIVSFNAGKLDEITEEYIDEKVLLPLDPDEFTEKLKRAAGEYELKRYEIPVSEVFDSLLNYSPQGSDTVARPPAPAPEQKPVYFTTEPMSDENPDDNPDDKIWEHSDLYEYMMNQKKMLDDLNKKVREISVKLSH